MHASSLCACMCTLAKYVAKPNLIVVVVIVVVIIVVSRQFKRSMAILKNLGQSNKMQASKHTHGGVYRVAPQLKMWIWSTPDLKNWKSGVVSVEN